MKESKYAAEGSSSMSSNAGNVVVRFWNPKLPAHFNAGLVTVAVISTMMVLQIRDSVSSGLFDDIKRMIHPLDPPEELDMPQRWNYSSHEFLPVISDWDDQRIRWIETDPNFKVPEGARPRILMVTGSSQEEGELYMLSYLLLRAGKNKQDYSQMHDMELFYNMVNPDPEFSDWWVKLPVIRMLMLRHPEVEWIWWLDADAVITDMTFEPPFAKLDQYNLVLHGVEDAQDGLDHDNLDLRGLSTSTFLIRNCQWSLDLLGAWAYEGTDSKREEAGDTKVGEEMETNRTEEITTEDDRSSLVALLVQDKWHPSSQQMWIPKVKLVEEAEYSVNGNWTVVGPKLEELSLGTDHLVPFVIHFEGCLPNPSEVPDLSRQDSENFDVCVEQLQRAFDFAENQVFKELGLERNILGNSLEPFIWKDGSEENSTETVYKILPVITNWDQKRKAYMESKPWTKKDHAVILSGSPPTPCVEKEGAHLLVRGLKNQIDYSRVHGIRIFYNMAVIHKNLTGWWSKLPAIKLMMINSLDVEWIWWTDSDAVFTNMDFAIPFERYNANGYNLVMWGVEHDVYDLKKYNGINTGNMFMRNCQWSLDLLDRWASLANTTENTLLNILSNRPPGWPSDDQSVLVYLLITEQEKWASKVFYENAYQPGDVNIVLSGDWMYWTELFVDEYKMRADRRPLVTHFAGCHPCKDYFRSDLCLQRYDRALNFADNQVLETYGLRHERLNSSHITGDFPRNSQEWTHTEIERMVGKTPEEFAATDGEVTTTKEDVEETTKEVVEVTTTKDGEVTTTKDEGVTTTKEEEVTTSKEEEVTTTKEEDEATTTKEEDEATTTKEEDEATPTKEEEEVTPTKEEEEVSKTKEEAVSTTEEEEKLEPTEDQEEGTTVTKEEQRAEPTEEQEDTTSTKEDEKVDQPEEEATSIKEEEEVPIKEQEEVTTTNEEEPTTEKEEVTTTNEEEPSTEKEEVPTTEEEEMTTPKEDVNVDVSYDQELDSTQEERVDKSQEGKAESLEESESRTETQEEMEAPEETEVKTESLEQVDRPEESDLGMESPQDVIDTTKEANGPKLKARKSRKQAPRRSKKHLR